MKSVLISIKTKWCEPIANCVKTIEVRKSRPNIETPFKCFIYCTNDRKIILDRSETDKIYLNVNIYRNIPMGLNGKVIGEFICDKIYDLFPFGMGTGIELFDELVSPEKFCKESCLTEQEICNYIGEKDGYGWHISDLKIYDKPKELSEFRKPCQNNDKTLCLYCDESEFTTDMVLRCGNNIERPPQSWCYVEELEC